MPIINHARVLDVELDDDRVNTAIHYGSYYWAIGLPDGREVFVWGDRVDVVASGALVVWQDTYEIKDGDGIFRREPLDEPRPLLILPGGAWIHFYAASAFDDHPVAVEHFVTAIPR
jgi:hypothetical protein